jgi:hypothetical protein
MLPTTLLRGFKEGGISSSILEMLKRTFIGPLAHFRVNNLRTTLIHNKEHTHRNNTWAKSTNGQSRV